jgi:hypothetical protein
MHASFLKILREQERGAVGNLERAQYALKALRALIQEEQTYLDKESPCEESKPSASDAASTGS